MVHDIASRLRPSMCRALPFFHALSGCDTTSQLLRVGKKTARDRRSSMPEITQAFISLTARPESFTFKSQDMRLLERFCILMYSKSSSSVSLNDTRPQMFSNGSQTLENLPPTTAAYYQHVRRCILQSCYVWNQSLLPRQVIPNYADWGWKYDEKQEADCHTGPLWRMLAQLVSSLKDVDAKWHAKGTVNVLKPI